MLLVPTEIRPSPIHGIGLFAKEFIAKGTIVWRFDSRIDRIYSEEELSHLPPLAQEHMDHFAFYYKAAGLWIACGDNGRFVNHSDTPNLVSGDGFDQTRAARDIQPGEELTDDYSAICNEFAVNGWAGAPKA